MILYVGDVHLCHCVCQQGLRTLQDLAPEMRLAMACDTEEEEGADGEMTGDEIFDSEPGTSVNTTPAATPMPPIDTLVEQTTVILEPEPKIVSGGVIREQVTGLHEHQRPGSEQAGVSVVTEQPVKSEPLPRCQITSRCLNSVIGTCRDQLLPNVPVLYKQGGLDQRVASSTSSFSSPSSSISSSSDSTGGRGCS